MKQENKEMKQVRKNIEKQSSQRLKKSIWERFEDFVGIFFISVFILIAFAVINLIFALLIENPISLAILCFTILLIIIWSKK